MIRASHGTYSAFECKYYAVMELRVSQRKACQKRHEAGRESRVEVDDWRWTSTVRLGGPWRVCDRCPQTFPESWYGMGGRRRSGFSLRFSSRYCTEQRLQALHVKTVHKNRRSVSPLPQTSRPHPHVCRSMTVDDRTFRPIKVRYLCVGLTNSGR